MVQTPQDPSETSSDSQHVPLLIINITSIVGILITFLATLGIIFIFVQGLLSSQEFVYQGVLIVMLMVAIITGLLLSIVGVTRERKRRRNGLPPSLSEQSYLQHPFAALMSGLILTSAAVLVMATGSYQVYRATESVEFCGLLCHSVMRPEWVTYQGSAHSRVACVECHIGEGADWFVRSKLSGARQIYAVLFDDYSKPIPTPIEHLRPARETCEQCHWPQKFVGFKEKIYTYYLGDEENSRHQIRLLIKIGGEEEAMTQKGSGIHYYMLKNKIEYLAEDHDRQSIVYVKMTKPDQSVVEYKGEDFAPSPEDLQAMRTMDCLDCHNRPSHRFRTPMDIINDDMRKGLIPTDVPNIKQAAIYALDESYENTDQAMLEIEKRLALYYQTEFTDYSSENPDIIKHAITGVQGIYGKSIFPEMKASWKAYPNNLGHRDWPGCFRCHNEEMVNADGETLYTTCNDCHVVLAQGDNINQVTVDFEVGLPFHHPGNDEDLEEYTECSECHSGGKEIYE